MCNNGVVGGWVGLMLLRAWVWWWAGLVDEELSVVELYVGVEVIILVCAERMAEEFEFLRDMSEDKFLELMNGVFVVVLVGCMVELCICMMCDLVVTSILSGLLFATIQLRSVTTRARSLEASPIPAKWTRGRRAASQTLWK